MRRRLLFISALALASVVAFTGPAAADFEAFGAVMTGEQEAPNPGDPDGIGFAFFTFNSATGEICYRLRAQGIEPARAAHIHRAPPGQAGPVVVGLAPPTNGRSSGCTMASRGLVQSIIDNPGAYYVNVHNAPYPGGALRGQLG